MPLVVPCDLHQQEQASEETAPLAPTFPPLSILNSQRDHIQQLVSCGLSCTGMEPVAGFINGEGGDGSAVLPAIYIKSVQKEGEKL